MFYNGSKIFVNLYIYILTLWILVMNNLSFKGFLTFNKLGLNESMMILNIISSSTYTYLLAVWCMSYKNWLGQERPTYMHITLHTLVTLYYFDNFYNVGSISQLFKIVSLNTNLQNGLLNIHPFFVYILYGWLILFLIGMYIARNTYTEMYLYMQIFVKYTYIILIGTILGAWWASQEFNWGGYWSWDPVELISLFIFFFMLFILHIKHKNIVQPKLIKIFFCIFIIYCVLRLGAVTTIHSFIRSVGLPYYVDILLGVMWVYVCILFSKQHPYYSSLLRHMRLLFVFQIALSLLCLFFVSLLTNNVNTPLFVISSLIDKIYLILIFLGMLYNIFLNQFTKRNNYLYLISSYVILLFVSLTLDLISILICVLFFTLFTTPKVYKSLHTILLCFYMIFVLFFVQISEYSHNIVDTNTRISINYFSFNKNIGMFYEISFFEIKNMYISNVKSVIQHIFGFNLFTNNTTTIFLNSKTNFYNLMFIEEFLVSIIFILLLFILTQNQPFNILKFTSY